MADTELPKGPETTGDAQIRVLEKKNEIAKETFWRWIIAGSFITLGVILAACMVGAFYFHDVGQRQWFQNTGTTIVGALIGFISGFYSKGKAGK
jgi:hypothetical protein